MVLYCKADSLFLDFPETKAIRSLPGAQRANPTAPINAMTKDAQSA